MCLDPRRGRPHRVAPQRRRAQPLCRQRRRPGCLRAWMTRIASYVHKMFDHIQHHRPGWVQSDGLGRGQQAAVRRPLSHTPAYARGASVQAWSRLTAARGASGSGDKLVATRKQGRAAHTEMVMQFANLATQCVVCGTTSRPIRPEPWFPATAGRMRLFPGLPSSEGRSRRRRTAGASLDFAKGAHLHALDGPAL